MVAAPGSRDDAPATVPRRDTADGITNPRALDAPASPLASPTPPIPARERAAASATPPHPHPATPHPNPADESRALRTALADSDALRAAGRLDQAAARLDRALREHPRDPLVSLTALTLARIHTARGDAPGVVTALDLALSGALPAALEADARAQLEAARAATASPAAAERWRRAR